MPALVIRRALPADAAAISGLITDLAGYFTVHPDGRGAEPFLRSVSPASIAGYIADPGLDYRAAFAGGTLAGVVAVRDGRHVFHLFVAARLHRQGVARRLWETARAAAIASGNGGEFTVNSSPFAVPVYMRFGFRVTGARVEQDGIAYVPMQLSPGGDPSRRPGA